MNTGLYFIEWTGFAGLGRRFAGRLQHAPVNYFRSALVWLPLVLMAGFGAWTLLAGYASKPAESEPVRIATTSSIDPAPLPAAAADAAPGGSRIDAAATPADAVAPEALPVDGLRISSQSWRRGGLGSNALVTFTLHNRNPYAVKDIEIACAFSRRNGRHLTDRTRMIHGTIRKKSRRTFARLHVGFVNINAARAKCTPVAASRE